MSTLLSFEIEWIDQPAANDPVERKTWASVRISVGHRLITRLYDRSLQGERGAMYLPAFGLARWIVTNWWFLLYETAYSERLPNLNYPIQFHQREWIARHSLRSADTGLMLPAMYLYSSGTEVCVHWASDPIEGFPHMPARFESNGHFYVDRAQVQMSLQNVVDTVLARCAGISSPDVERLRIEWSALMQATNDERDFCSAAARMGLDAYRSDQMAASITTLLEEHGSEAENNLVVRDFFESAEPHEASAAWHKISLELKARHYLPNEAHQTVYAEDYLPYRRGYTAARVVRKSLGLEDVKPIGAMSKFARTIGKRGITFADRQSLAFSKIRAITGENKERTILISGPKPPNSGAQRFLEARGIYHSLYSNHGPRLITDAITSDQQSARAFAAELLAPAVGLMTYLDEHPNMEETKTVQDLAGKYNVNQKVIQLQLQNATFGL